MLVLGGCQAVLSWAVTAAQPPGFFLLGRVGPCRALAPLLSVTTQTGFRADPPTHASSAPRGHSVTSLHTPAPAALEEMAPGDDVALAPAVCQHGVV